MVLNNANSTQTKQPKTVRAQALRKASLGTAGRTVSENHFIESVF